VRFDFVHPGRGTSGKRNDQSCVLRIAAGGHAALLPADIEAPAEKLLLANQPDRLRAEVLVAAHHGSKTSSAQEFIDAVQPQLVIFPAGWHNQFHFPRGVVVDRYLGSGAELHMTGNGGAIRVHVDAKGVGEASDWRADHPRLWREAAEPVPQDLK